VTLKVHISESAMWNVVVGLCQEPPDTKPLEAQLISPLKGKYRFASLTADGWTLRIHTDEGSTAEVVLVVEDWHRGDQQHAVWAPFIARERLMGTR